MTKIDITKSQAKEYCEEALECWVGLHCGWREDSHGTGKSAIGIFLSVLINPMSSIYLSAALPFGTV